jgi:hypothetical protein
MKVHGLAQAECCIVFLLHLAAAPDLHVPEQECQYTDYSS